MTRSRSTDVVYLVLGVATFAAALLLTPLPGGSVAFFGLELPGLCLMRQTFDTACASCGMTRAFVHAAHGDLGASLAASPAGLFLFAVLVGQIPYRLVRLVKPASPRLGRHVGAGAVVTFALLMLIVWGGRLIGVLPPP